MIQRFSIFSFLLLLWSSLLYGQVSNLTNAGSGPYATIQLAIDNAATLNGDILEVAAGSYTESPNISKEITLQSAAGAPTTTISGSITINADNVSIDGFTINNHGGQYGIYAQDQSGITIQNNIISDIGPSDKASTPASTNFGIGIICSSVDITGITIKDNVISQVIGGTYTNGAGIAVGWTSGSNNVDGLLIQNNNISNIKSFDGVWQPTYAWPERRGAYGILINHSPVNSPQILNNTISDLEGLWSHGIGLEGNTPNALVQGNVIDNLVDHKSPANPDATAIMVESNLSAATVTIEHNSFSNTWLGVRNATAYDVTAEFNWWGDTDPSDNIYNTGGGSIDYTPWLSNGADADPGTEGFQGDLSEVTLDDSDPDALTDALDNLPATGGTLNLASGSYNVTNGAYNAFVINGTGPIVINGNGSTINHGSPAITVAVNNVTITSFVFNYDSPDYAIDVQAGAYDVTITNCDFLNVNGAAVGNGVINRGTGTVDARNNYWNSVSGPTTALNPSGAGNIASNISTGSLLISPWWGDLGHTFLVYLPTLTSPGNTLTGVSLLPIFTWQDVNYETGYTVEISTSPTFATTLASSPVLAANTTTYQFSEDEIGLPLNNGTNYYWRVLVSTSVGNVSSEIWNFTTVTGFSIGVGNPAHGSDVYQYDPLYFSWYIAQAQGSVKFRMEILASDLDPAASVWAGGTYVYEADDISNVFQTVNGLLGGTKYWWRLIAYIEVANSGYDPADDKIVVFSQHYSFTTKGGAVTAYPSWPIGANEIYTLTPMFGWYTMTYEPGATFEIIVAETNGVDGSGMLNGGTATTYPTTGPQSGTTFTIPSGELNYSTTYYWQIVTHYNGTQTYSALASFETYEDVSAVVNKPVLSYPIGGATIYTDAPTLYWYGNSYGSAIEYSIELSTNGGTTYADWPSTVVGDQFITLSGLAAGQDYTWKVVSNKGLASEIESDPASFTVAGGSSSYPVLSYPTGGDMVYTATPNLGWYLSGSTLGWSGYYVKWVETSAFGGDWAAESGTVINDIYQTNYQVPTLIEGETYRWAVALYDGTTPPVHADYVESSFSVYGGASSIVVYQQNPADGSTNISTDVNFTWWVSGVSSSITGYYVEYSPYVNPLLDPSIGTTPASTNMFTSATVSGGTTYKWRVVVTLSTGGPVYSGWYEFTTLTTSLAVQPTAGSPSNGVTVATDYVDLSWYTKAAPSEGQTYQVEISDSPTFDNFKLSTESEKNSIKIEALEKGEYFWRVKGKNYEGESYYSNLESFKVGDAVTDVSDLEVLPTEFTLEQNYPNPFNPSTMIQYSMPEAAFVSLKIYNLLGQEVKTLILEDKSAGSHSIKWNGENNIGKKVTSGIYIYRIEAGEYIDSKKLMLLK